MTVQELAATAHRLVGSGKGILAMDESNSTCNKRFVAVGAPATEEARRSWRELIATTPGLGDSISGAILYDETIRQQKKDGTSFVRVLNGAGIIPGIKVDTGAKPLACRPGETVTEGLDGLCVRLLEYFQMGARFAKWRAVIRRRVSCRAGAASRPTHTHWAGKRLCARKPDSFRLSSRKF
jgi:fructose-bisphosphate aldolase class I